MALEAIYACSGATHTSAIAGVTHARITPKTTVRIDPGEADSLWPADVQVTYYEVAVELFGLDAPALAAKIGAAKADLVIDTQGDFGAAETLTASNVYFSQYAGDQDLPAPDEGGQVSQAGIRGFVHFEAGETFADVLTAA